MSGFQELSDTDGWNAVVEIMRWEYSRLKRNQGLYPQVAEEYDNDFTALSHLIVHFAWNRDHNIPFPRGVISDKQPL